MAIEKRNVFVKIEHYEAINSKKLLLGMIESMLNMLLVADKFSSVSNKESKEISHLKARYFELAGQIDNLAGILPKEEQEEIIPFKGIYKEKEKAGKKAMTKEEIREKELKQIKERLAKFK